MIRWLWRALFPRWLPVEGLTYAAICKEAGRKPGCVLAISVSDGRVALPFWVTSESPELVEWVSGTRPGPLRWRWNPAMQAAWD